MALKRRGTGSRKTTITFSIKGHEKLTKYKHLINVSELAENAVLKAIEEIEEFKKWQKTRRQP